jgi:hypothetical protein
MVSGGGGGRGVGVEINMKLWAVRVQLRGREEGGSSYFRGVRFEGMVEVVVRRRVL